MADFSSYGGPSAEWLAVEKTLPAMTFDISQPLDKLQATVNADREKNAAEAMKTLGPKVSIKEHSIPTRDSSAIEARSYRPVSKPDDEVLPVMLWFHGGGFFFGSVLTDEPASAQMSANLGVAVLNVNYRHTPQHTFPTSWNDTHDAFFWLHKNAESLAIDPNRVVVGGISAGGQLTASLVLEQHLGKDSLDEYPKIAGQVLLIPALAHMDTYKDGPLKQMKSPDVSSIVENENAPVLPMRTVRFFTDLLKTGLPGLKDTKLNIGNATKEEVKGMPPAMFGIAGLDPLRDEALLYAKLLTEAGVPTRINLFKGVPHGCRRFGKALKANDYWDETIEDGFTWTLGKPSATGKFEVVVKE